MTDPAQDEELELSPEQALALQRALRSAWQPGEIDEARHERLLELALEDPLAPPSAEEVAESARLREALAGRGDHADLPLVRALAAAAEPERQPADAARLAALVAREPASSTKTGRVIYVAFGAVSAALAAAAALVLVVGSLTRKAEPAAALATPAALATSRSSAPLFDDRFTTEATTARIDRITSVRERELRQNRYVAWGVR